MKDVEKIVDAINEQFKDQMEKNKIMDDDTVAELLLRCVALLATSLSGVSNTISNTEENLVWLKKGLEDAD